MKTPARKKKVMYADLPTRAIEILSLMSEGLNSPEIAERLFLSRRTVRNYQQNIMDRLDIHTAGGVVAYALRKGLIR